MRTSVYVDGFNLYYGALKQTHFKWLDINALCQLLFPQHQINQIRYFSARVSPTPTDPQAHNRQQLYFRALATTPNLTIHLGHFLRHKKWRPLVSPQPNQRPLAEVWLTEEKGSDVALASHLLNDGHKNIYDTAIVISNDSDLAPPIQIVRDELGKRVGILNPHKRPAQKLKVNCDFLKQIRSGPLGASQFPVQLADKTGVFHKPAAW